MAEDAYAEAIVQTFRKRALRTAHVIDDAFPTYLDLMAGDGERFSDRDLARGLYELFRSHHIPCDVENTVSDLDALAERVRKSDLVILDYNLAPGDARTSVALIRKLSHTKHFNTVVLYTADENLDRVWLNVACGLRGAWAPAAGTMAEGVLEEAQDRGLNLPEPSIDLLEDVVIRGGVGLGHRSEVNFYGEVLEGLVTDLTLPDVVQAIVERGVRALLREDPDSLDAVRQSVAGGRQQDGPRWLQAGNCFVAIMGKRTKREAQTASEIFDVLDAALCKWRPNILQVMISEIQNILELDAIATDEIHLKDPHVQVSLCYFLLSSLVEGGVPLDEAGAFSGPIHAILDKLIDGVGQRLVTNVELRDLAERLLASEVGRVGFDPGASMKPAALLGHSRRLAGEGGDANATIAMMRLNAFLSTEPFRGHLTTGTVFTDGAEHWLCLSPACDMAGRPAGDSQPWAKSLHPSKPMIAARLERQTDDRKALKSAHDNRTFFIDLDGGVVAFDVLPAKGGPRYEFMLIEDLGRVTSRGGHPHFAAARLAPSADENAPFRTLTPIHLKIVGQVRANYASRFLQQTGSWLSRIGLDFMQNAI